MGEKKREEWRDGQRRVGKTGKDERRKMKVREKKWKRRTRVRSAGEGGEVRVEREVVKEAEKKKVRGKTKSMKSGFSLQLRKKNIRPLFGDLRNAAIDLRGKKKKAVFLS